MNELLTILLGSNRTGFDLAILLIGLAFFLVLVSCRRLLVEALVAWFAAKVKVIESQSTSCVLMANALSDIQDAQEANRKALELIHDKHVDIEGKLDKVLEERRSC